MAPSQPFARPVSFPMGRRNVQQAFELVCTLHLMNGAARGRWIENESSWSFRTSDRRRWLDPKVHLRGRVLGRAGVGFFPAGLADFSLHHGLRSGADDDVALGAHNAVDQAAGKRGLTSAQASWLRWFFLRRLHPLGGPTLGPAGRRTPPTPSQAWAKAVEDHNRQLCLFCSINHLNPAFGAEADHYCRHRRRLSCP